MKNFIGWKSSSASSAVSTLALLVVTLLSSNSHAIYNEGWERPLASGIVEVQSASGVYERATAVQVTMNKRDGQKTATSFTLDINGSSALYRVISSTPEGCGSVAYHAELDLENMITIPEAVYRLTLIDNSERICKDLVSGTWQLKLTAQELEDVAGTLSGVSEPETVFTIMRKETNRAEY